jgi:hypothetical protein
VRDGVGVISGDGLTVGRGVGDMSGDGVTVGDGDAVSSAQFFKQSSYIFLHSA